MRSDWKCDFGHDLLLYNFGVFKALCYAKIEFELFMLNDT